MIASERVLLSCPKERCGLIVITIAENCKMHERMSGEKDNSKFRYSDTVVDKSY